MGRELFNASNGSIPSLMSSQKLQELEKDPKKRLSFSSPLNDISIMNSSQLKSSEKSFEPDFEEDFIPTQSLSTSKLSDSKQGKGFDSNNLIPVKNDTKAKSPASELRKRSQKFSPPSVLYSPSKKSNSSSKNGEELDREEKRKNKRKGGPSTLNTSATKIPKSKEVNKKGPKIVKKRDEEEEEEKKPSNKPQKISDILRSFASTEKYSAISNERKVKRQQATDKQKARKKKKSKNSPDMNDANNSNEESQEEAADLSKSAANYKISFSSSLKKKKPSVSNIEENHPTELSTTSESNVLEGQDKDDRMDFFLKESSARIPSVKSSPPKETPTTPPKESEPAAGGFSLGAASAPAEPPKAEGGFSFGSAEPNLAAASSFEPKTPSFGFGETPKAESTVNFGEASFGAKNDFSLGAGTPAEAPKADSGFSFAEAKAESSAFSSFGTDGNNKNDSGFSFGTENSASGAFPSFGAAAEAPKADNGFSFGNETKSESNAFPFGGEQKNDNGFSFGTESKPESRTASFGAQIQKSSGMDGGFSFGGDNSFAPTKFGKEQQEVSAKTETFSSFEAKKEEAAPTFGDASGFSFGSNVPNPQSENAFSFGDKNNALSFGNQNGQTASTNANSFGQNNNFNSFGAPETSSFGNSNAAFSASTPFGDPSGKSNSESSFKVGGLESSAAPSFGTSSFGSVAAFGDSFSSANSSNESNANPFGGSSNSFASSANSFGSQPSNTFGAPGTPSNQFGPSFGGVESQQAFASPFASNEANANPFGGSSNSFASPAPSFGSNTPLSSDPSFGGFEFGASTGTSVVSDGFSGGAKPKKSLKNRKYTKKKN